MDKLCRYRAVLEKIQDEGIEDAVLEALEGVFIGNGASKYPVGYWRSKTKKEHAQKAAGHLQALAEGEKREEESQRHHRAHAILRQLMILQMELEDHE